MSQKPKIAVFIDSGNLWNVYKVIGKLLDFSKFFSFFANKFQGDVFRIFYYVAYPPDGTRPKVDCDKLHKFLTFLKKGLKFHVVKKPLKTIHLRDQEGELIFDQKTGKPQAIEKGNFDVELTIDAIRSVKDYDIAVFLSGDSDFLPLITDLRVNEKKKVYIFSSANCVSKELRTGADGYFDLADFAELHGNKLEAKNNTKK